MEDENQSAISPSSRPTMDQLEQESGLTWDEALVRLKDLETTLKHQIQTDIREMKLCMSSNKIEDVSLKASRLHDIRRTLASSRALVREECAIMKEFEKIKGILGASRTMDEDDWSSTKNQTRFWGDKLAEVRRRQRRLSGDVEGLDGVVSDIISQGSLKSDSMDSLDNLSFHLTNYPLFNNAPYGHHLSVPSRPGSAMSDVSAVSTGIAGYFKGRDTTTDLSQSEAESNITPHTQRKKLFTRTSKKEPSMDGSECEEPQYSMQEMYLMEKRKSAIEFKRKALAEKDANIKAIEDHEGAVSECENYGGEGDFSMHDWSEAEQGKKETCDEELEMKEKQLNFEGDKNQFELEQEAQTQKLQEEKERIEIERLKEEEIRIEAQRLKAEEVEQMQIEAQRLKEEQEEKEKLEAQKKKEAEEKRIKLEEKKKKEEEKKKKLEEKKKKEEEKKRKMELKQKKEEEKKKKLEEKQKKEEEKQKKMEEKEKLRLEAEKKKIEEEEKQKKMEEEEKLRLEAEKKKIEEEETQKKLEETEKLRLEAEKKKMEEEEKLRLEAETKKIEEDEKIKLEMQIQEQQNMEEKNADQNENEINHQETEDNTQVKPKRSKRKELKEKKDTKRDISASKSSKSRSQSKDRKSIQSKQDEMSAESTQIEMGEEEMTQSIEKPSIEKKITPKSRSQSKDRKSIQSKQEEMSAESTQIEMGEEEMTQSIKKPSIEKKITPKSRSQSKDRKSIQSKQEEISAESTQIEMGEEEMTQTTKKPSIEKKKTPKSRSQSKDRKSIQSKQEEISAESTQIEMGEEEMTQSTEKPFIEKKITPKSRSQSKDRQSIQSKQEEISAESTQIEMGEEEITQSTEKPSIEKKIAPKSRSQSKDRKSIQSKQEEMSAESTQIEMGEEEMTQSIKKPSIEKKKTPKSRSQSKDRKSIQSKQEEMSAESTQIEMGEEEITQSTEKPSIEKKKTPKSRSQSKDRKSIQSKQEEMSAESTQIEMGEEEITQSTEKPSIEKKITPKSRSQSKDRKSIQSKQEEMSAESTQIEMGEEEMTQTTKKPSIEKKITPKSRSQSKDRKSIQSKQEEMSAESTQIEMGEEEITQSTEKPSIEKKKTPKSRSQSKDRKSIQSKQEEMSAESTQIEMGEEEMTQSIEKPSIEKKITPKSRSQSKDRKSIQSKQEEMSAESTQIEMGEEEITQSTEKPSIGKKITPKSRSQSKDRKSIQSKQEEMSAESTQIEMGEEEMTQTTKKPSIEKKKTPKSRSQSKDRKSIQSKQEEISAESTQIEMGEEEMTQSIKKPSIEKKKTPKSRSQSKDRKSIQSKQEEISAESTQIEMGEEEITQSTEKPSIEKKIAPKSRSQSREKKSILIEDEEINVSSKQAEYYNQNNLEGSSSKVEEVTCNEPYVAKPRRSKGKLIKRSPLSSDDPENQEQLQITEVSSMSQGAKFRSQSKEKTSIPVEEEEISVSSKQAEYFNQNNDKTLSHVEEVSGNELQVVKPRRSKGKLEKQTTLVKGGQEDRSQTQLIKSESHIMDIEQVKSLFPDGEYIEDTDHKGGSEGSKPRSMSREGKSSQLYEEEGEESELLREQHLETSQVEDISDINAQVTKPWRSKGKSKKSIGSEDNSNMSGATSGKRNSLTIRDVFELSLDHDDEYDESQILNNDFKQGSPEYAEIDYEQDQLMMGEENLGRHLGMEEKVQKNKRPSENASQDRLYNDSNVNHEEPIYAKVQRKTSSRPTSTDRNDSRKEGSERSQSRTSSIDRKSIQDAETMGTKNTPSSSRTASRERKNLEKQRSQSGERGNISELESKMKTPTSAPLKKPVRSSRMKKSESINLNDENSFENIYNDSESMGRVDNNFWDHEDQFESSSEFPDMVSIKKPERKSRKKLLDIETRKAMDDSRQNQMFNKKEDEYPFEIVNTDAMRSLKDQNYSIDNQDSLDIEEFEDANEYLHDTDYELGSAELVEENKLNSIRRSNAIKSFLSSGSHETRDNLYVDEEMERPLSALGTYSADDEPEDSVDELISSQERTLIREKPDGMDKEELRQFDPRAFPKRKRQAFQKQKTELLSPESSFDDEEYFKKFNQGMKSGKQEPQSSQVQLTQSRNLSRERPMKLDLKDIKPRLGDKVKGNFYKDEALMDELDLQNSYDQMWIKEPGRRRRTVSHSFESEENEYTVGDDDVEFDSDINNYSFLKPPPRKSRSRSGSVSPLPKEKENIGPKLERMFSTDQDILEFEYDDNGVKKMKKVSFATENEQFVLRPDPEVRSIPGTKLFTFSPSRTHEQPPDNRQRGRQNKKLTIKKRSSSADVFPTWSKNSALSFLKSMANLSKGSRNKVESNEMNLEQKYTNYEPSSKFDDAFAAASSEMSFNTNELLHEIEFRSENQSNSMNPYFDNMKMDQRLSTSSKTTQSLDNVNLQKNLMGQETPYRPYSTEPSSSYSEPYKTSNKKQTSSMFGNIIQRAKSLSRGNSRQNSEERSIFKNLFHPKSINKNSDAIPPPKHKRSLSFDGFTRKISGGSSSTKAGGESSIMSTEENFNDGAEAELLTESEFSHKNRHKMKKGSKGSVNKTDFDKLFARGLALSTEKEKELMGLETAPQITTGNLLDIDHRPTTPFEVFSKDEVFKKSQQGAGISFEEKVKYFLDDLSHQPHTSNFQAPMNCSPVAAAAAVAAMAPPRSTISPETKKRGSLLLPKDEPKPEPKESPHQFLRRAEEFVKLAEVDSEYSQPVWPAIVQSPDDLPPPKPTTLHSNVPSRPKSPLYPNFTNLVPASNSPPAPLSSRSENVLSKSTIPAEVSQALAPMMAVMMEMKNSSKSPEPRTESMNFNTLGISGGPRAIPGIRQRSASTTDPFPGSYKTDLGRAEYGTLTRKDIKSSKGRASSVSSRFPTRDNSLDRVNKLRRSTSKDSEINHRRRSQEPLILDPTRSDSRISNYSADVPDLEDADLSNAMLKTNFNSRKTGEGEFLRPSSNILETKGRVLDQMEKEKLALQEAKSWFQTVLMIILCVCAIIFIQNERRL